MNKINPMDVIIINNHTEWFELYIKGSYQLIDPVIINAIERVEDFHWDEKNNGLYRNQITYNIQTLKKI